MLVRENDDVLSDLLVKEKNNSISHSVLKLDHQTKWC